MSDALELWPKDMVERAMRFAHEKHDEIGQKRKYTGEPYWVHTDNVAALAKKYGLTDDQQAAAHLHDTLEDTKIEIKDLIYSFPIPIVAMVIELTDKYTSEKHPHLKRAERKKLEAERIATISAASQEIKALDLMDNTASIVAHDKGFAKIYLKEKSFVLSKLTKVKKEILIDLENQLKKELAAME